MKVWTCVEFAGHWPVGTAAVVVADTAAQAAHRLGEVLKERGLSQVVAPESMLLVPNKPCVLLLRDGDY